MAARKKKARRTRSGSAKGVVASLERELRDLSKEVERRLAPLRKEIDKAERRAGGSAAKLLRQARQRLNKVEIKGQSELQKFLRQRRRQISRGLTEAARTVQPSGGRGRRKKAGRKKAVRRRKA